MYRQLMIFMSLFIQLIGHLDVFGCQTILKTDTALRPHLGDLSECGTVNIWATVRYTQQRVKERDRGIRLARAQTSITPEHVHTLDHKSP